MKLGHVLSRCVFVVLMVLAWAGAAAQSASVAPAATTAEAAGEQPPPDINQAIEAFHDKLNATLVDYYMAEDRAAFDAQLSLPQAITARLDASLTEAINHRLASDDLPWAAGAVRGMLQQAYTLKMAQAVLAGDLGQAKSWRVHLYLPRGVSAVEGALLLETLGSKEDKRDDAARLLVREAITWQTTRVRQLLSQIDRAAAQDVPLPGRLREQLAEAITLATLPQSLVAAAGLESVHTPDAQQVAQLTDTISASQWPDVRAAFKPMGRMLESSLPSLLSEKEVQRVERLLLKLAKLIPTEYSAGVREGQIVVALEYREAVSFTAQCKQLVAQLAPVWLSGDQADQARASLAKLEAALEDAEKHIADIDPSDKVDDAYARVRDVLENEFGITLTRYGTTADIVEEVMLETRSLLSQSLAAALQGRWSEAEQLRLEAYTTYDPALEARLMPRDPKLAMDIESLLLDGLEKPGVKALLDKRASPAELEAAYTRVNEALQQASVLLKSGISDTAAIFNALSIVLREGLEGLLVLIAILAGLKGEANANRRKLLWGGVGAAMIATGLTWVVSQTLITSLNAYAEVIAAVTGIVAIFVLLLITNWLFHQIYWKQWISTLKTQAVEGESAWQLVSVGFAIGYREGFETVLFLQNLALDSGGQIVAIGVVIGLVILIGIGFAGLRLGMRLPYFKLLLVTAAMVGLVLITFTGGTIRALQTIGWLPVHRLLDMSWPQWMGTWLGMYNTWESVVGQFLAVGIVLGTWRIARFKAKRAATKRRKAMEEAKAHDKNTALA